MRHASTPASNPFHDPELTPTHAEDCPCGVHLITASMGPTRYVSAVGIEECEDAHMQCLLEWFAQLIVGRCAFCAAVAWSDVRQGRDVQEMGVTGCRHRPSN